MNSTTESPSTSAHLSSVKELLAELDKMKDKGIGARDRLDFILEAGSGLVEDFDFHDAFDMELRAQTRRMSQLNELETTMSHARHQWDGGPIRDDVKEAARRLFGHLGRFLKDASQRESGVETEMLGQVWDWAPDIRYLYPWLTAWSGPIYRPNVDYGVAHYSTYPAAPEAPVPEEPSKEVKELLTLKDKLYEEEATTSVPLELPSENDQFDELEKKALQLHQAELERLRDLTPKATEGTKEAEPTPRRTFPLKRESVNGEEDSRVVATVSSSVPVVKELDDHPDHIRRDAWTMALRECTLEDWRFRQETTGHTDEGDVTVLLWNAGSSSEGRLEILELPDAQVRLSLRVLNDEVRFVKHDKVMSVIELRELHLNPLEFVKMTLES